jgi:hypothetical protein
LAPREARDVLACGSGNLCHTRIPVRDSCSIREHDMDDTDQARGSRAFQHPDASRGPLDIQSPLIRETHALLARAFAIVAKGGAPGAWRIAYPTDYPQWSDARLDDFAVVRDQLRETIVALARVQHAQGVPAVRMVTSLKAIVSDARPAGVLSPLARELSRDVISWSIEAYFAT